jgi:adenylate cyclase
VKKQSKNSLLSTFIWRLLNAGTGRVPQSEKRTLVVVNIVSYLVIISSMSYALTFSLQDFTALQPVIWGNVVLSVLAAFSPLLHRYGRLASIFYLVAIIFSFIFFFISFLGRESGIQLNYIGAAAVVMVVCGERYLRYAIATIFLAGILHLAAWFSFPNPRQGLELDPSFLATLYTMSALSIMAIIFVVVVYAFHLVRQAQDQTDALLHNIMPTEIAERLKAEPDATIADRYKKVSIIFADMTGFTRLTSQLGPYQTTELLNDLYSQFDVQAAAHGVEKIKTIGDAYMAVAGIPKSGKNDPENIAKMALKFMDVAQRVSKKHGVDFGLRIGIASGPVMAGIIGKDRFAYDVWGDTVNLAARLEPISERGQITVDDTLRDTLKDLFDFAPLVDLDLKGIGKVTAWRMEAKAQA